MYHNLGLIFSFLEMLYGLHVAKGRNSTFFLDVQLSYRFVYPTDV